MATNSYTTLETGTAPDQLIYDEHKPTDRPIMIPAGQTITRGDILYLAAEGARATEPVADEDNTGNGTMTVYADGSTSNTAQTVTATYDGTNWDFVGSVSGNLALNQATGLNIDIGPASVDIVAGTDAFALGDVFTFDIVRAGNQVAREATGENDLNDPNYGVAIAAETITVAADSAPQPSFAYVQGVFNSRSVGNLAAVAGSDTENIISVLQDKGIILKEAEL